MDALMGKNVILCLLLLKYFIVVLFYCSFSRRVMWLRVANTNNDPRVVAKHFVDCVKFVGGSVSGG